MAIKKKAETDDLEKLSAIVRRLEALEAIVATTPSGETQEKKSTRRQLLKLAGASLVGAAGAAALRAVPSTAADGDTVTVGGLFTETLGYSTAIDQTATGQITPGIWAAYGASHSYGFLGEVGAYGTAVVGAASGDFGQGVSGRVVGGSFGVGVEGFDISGTGVGVYGVGKNGGFFTDTGPGGGSGVVAQSTYGLQALLAYAGATNASAVRAIGPKGGTALIAYNGHTSSMVLYGYTAATNTIGLGVTSWHGVGIQVNAPTSFGVFSYGGLGVMGAAALPGAPGVAAVSKSGPDVKLGGTGRLVQYSAITGGVYGAPTYTPAYGYFEMVRDTYGAMWINRATQGTGFTGQNAWKRINAVRVDTSDGTGGAYKPLRLVDSRFGTGGPAGPFGDNTNHTYTVAGAGSGAQKIPSTAVAVVGNLTAVGFTPAGGFLAIHPAGVAFNPSTDPSSLNFSGSVGAWANSFICGLGTGANAGKLTVYVKCYSGGHTNIIIDITGYIE